MSLLDKLKEKAVSTVNDPDKQKEWAEKGFDSALKEARGLLPKSDDEGELKALRETAEYGLDKLEKHRDTLVDLGANGMRSTLIMIGLGQYDEGARYAALLRVRESGSWDDATKLIVDTAEAGNVAKRELDAKIEEIKSVLKDIGTTAAKSLLPFLLAVI